MLQLWFDLEWSRGGYHFSTPVRWLRLATNKQSNKSLLPRNPPDCCCRFFLNWVFSRGHSLELLSSHRYSLYTNYGACKSIPSSLFSFKIKTKKDTRHMRQSLELFSPKGEKRWRRNGCRFALQLTRLAGCYLTFKRCDVTRPPDNVPSCYCCHNNSIRWFLTS